MNIVVIFAGGVGKRMHTKEKPKQFLEIYNKPIIVHTMEKFEKHKDIDGIVIVCVENWISYMNDLVYKYRIEKVKKIVPVLPYLQFLKNLFLNFHESFSHLLSNE